MPNVEYPQVTEYLSLAAGDYDLTISLAGTDCATDALDLPSLTLTDGDIVDVFAIGLAPGDANFPLQIADTISAASAVTMQSIFLPIAR